MITLDDTTTGSTKFVGWESSPPVASCFGSGICTFTLTADTTVTGVFEPPQVLTTTVVGDGQDFVETSDYSLLLHRGLRCQKPLNQNSKSCSISYSYGTEETLTAVPAAGSKFVGWSGACAGTGTCTVLMDRAQDVTASFLNDVGIHVNAMEVTQGIQTTELPTRTSSQDTEVSYKGVSLSSNGGAVTTVKFAQDHATVVRVYVNTALPLERRAGPDHASVCVPGRSDARPGSDHRRSGPVGDGVPGRPLAWPGDGGAALAGRRTASTRSTLPVGLGRGNGQLHSRHRNSDPTEFFPDCGTTDCQDRRGSMLDLIHFNPVTVARIAPVAILVSSAASSVRGVSRPIGPLGWNPIDPQPDPVWQTVAGSRSVPDRRCRRTSTWSTARRRSRAATE